MPAAAFEAYVRARMELVREEAEREGEERQRAELARLQALDEAQRAVHMARKHIEEEILTSRCPRCKAAFLDFAGCCALKCHRCPCAFCAWCGKDCGADAHQHVASCGAKPAGADVFYPREDFPRAQKQRRAGVLRRYLNGLAEATRAALLREMRGTLREDYADVLRAFRQG